LKFRKKSSVSCVYLRHKLYSFFSGLICSFAVSSVAMNTRMIHLDPAGPDSKSIKAAAAIINKGGLVAFPTETVYGIACIAQADAIKRLDEIKNRPADKYYTVHIADRDDVSKYVPPSSISARGGKLLQKAWPGPITVIFELNETDLASQRQLLGAEVFDLLYNAGTIGLRCPNNIIAEKFLGLASAPVVAPSANISGHPPSVTAGQAEEQLRGKIEMILDGGPCKYKKSSTVVKIAKNTVNMLREGVVGESEVLEMATVRILFVCTGNTCRSPMAKLLCRKYLSEKFGCGIDDLGKMGYKVYSAGTMGVAGLCASPEVIRICGEKGINADVHRSGPVTCGMLEESDFVFAMTEAHRKIIIQMCPAAASKCILLGSADISDPIGSGIDGYGKCAEQIEKALKSRLGKIL